MPKTRDRIMLTIRIAIKEYLSYCISLKYHFAGKKAVTNLDPSNGGMGIRLNTIKMKLYIADRKKKLPMIVVRLNINSDAPESMTNLICINEVRI